MNKHILLMNSKTYYMYADVWYTISEVADSQINMWHAAEETGRAIVETYKVAYKTAVYCMESANEMVANVREIGEMLPDVEKNNPGLLDEMLDTMEYGG